MSPPARLSKAALRESLTRLPSWRLTADGLAMERAYDFADFNEAFGFMTRCALHAERLNHHPDWRNLYRRVEVRLSTHDVGGLTQRDLELASVMDRVAGGQR